jgi:hypothetical protein
MEMLQQQSAIRLMSTRMFFLIKICHKSQVNAAEGPRDNGRFITPSETVSSIIYIFVY